MLHKKVLPFISSTSSSSVSGSSESVSSTSRLVLVPADGGGTSKKSHSRLVDLIAISAHRCSSFFAEAAVLVLVLALLDRFMLKGRMELRWILSAFTISLILLAASIATDFSARRWLQRH